MNDHRGKSKVPTNCLKKRLLTPVRVRSLLETLSSLEDEDTQLDGVQTFNVPLDSIDRRPVRFELQISASDLARSQNILCSRDAEQLHRKQSSYSETCHLEFAGDLLRFRYSVVFVRRRCRVEGKCR